MIHSTLVTENQLDTWVRGHAQIAQGIIVELVYRLVAASCPKPNERRFPLGDSIGQPGPDGVLNTDYSYQPFVPEGMSFWEIGTGIDPAGKATTDYTDRTTKPATAESAAIRQESSFVFVTPLSGTRGWKQPAQIKWMEKRRHQNEWRDVRVIDGTRLIDWLRQFPSVELWLAQTMGLPAQQIETPEQRWSLLRMIGEPPPLTPGVFLANRDAACAKLKEVFSGTTLQLKLETRFPDQVVDFVSAFVADMDEESRIDVISRSLVVCGIDAWNAVTALSEPHVLIANFDLDQAGANGTILLEKTRRAGHAAIFGGVPGGTPHPNSAPIPNPKSYQVEASLKKAGYGEERARILARRSDGNLTSLLRCLQNLPVKPEWAERTPAAELAIAVLLGAWDEKSEADRAVVEDLSGNPYGEWIVKMREVALRPGTPLTQRDGRWKFVARYEGWYALGARLFDEHLDRLRKAAVAVLREPDPKFELPSEDRFASAIYGKVLSHSQPLRNGFAETLALLGSHPNALMSSSFGKAEATAVLAVGEILADSDWVLWASLNDFLPLLAEAAPEEFLDAVENTLNKDPCPFELVFAQETSGITGANYATGLIWALETLAWDPEYLTRVVITLGELAARDPGGSSSNRPANSLTTILLPWLPQTCAPVEKRRVAVATLLDELPSVAWKLLLSLLPESHSVSFLSRKPAWRETIPEDWSKGVTVREYREQVSVYTELAIGAAKSDLSKLAELVERLDDLPVPAQEQLIAYLGSDSVVSMPEADRLGLWTELVDLVTKHRKFALTEWALKPEHVDRIAAVAQRLAPDAPAFRHQRLFSERDFDLYEEKGNYEDQQKELEERRQRAIKEVAATGGIQLVLVFAASVQSPWRVGISFGLVADNDADRTILPDLLDTGQGSLAQFAGGFVRGRFLSRGWPWVDGNDTSQWAPARIGQLLSYLPFTPYTWVRSTRLLGGDESPYWTRTNANPYEANTGLEVAVDQLIGNGRPHAAIRCLHRMQHDKHPFDSTRVVRALLAALGSSEGAHAMDVYQIVDVIKALQDDPGTQRDDLFQVEWAYLPLLHEHLQAFPKELERRLANEPGFFCEVIRLVFRSNKKEDTREEPTEHTKNLAANAYRLLGNWRIVPGCREGGIYDGDALTAWLHEVQAECRETGHLEIAMTMLGRALIHTPPDPDGLWIHRSAAAALNAKDARYMRDGFLTGLFNSRGVRNFTAGQEERELAAKYRSQADAVEASGFHRLASTLRELAASYERDANRQASREPFDD